MKVFLVFTLALFALATAKYPLIPMNLTAYTLGFVDQLGLDTSSAEDATRCQAVINENLQDVQNLIDSVKEGPEQIITSLSKVIVAFKSDAVKVACEKYYSDVVNYFTGYLNLTEPTGDLTDLKWLAHYNYKLYRPYIIQQSTKWLMQLSDDSSSAYEAGKTEAYILQILTGIEAPTLVPYNVTNNTSTETEFSKAFAKGFLEFNHIKDQTNIETFAKCIDAFNVAGQAISDFEQDLANLTSLPAKIALVTKNVELTVDAVKSCVGDAGHIFKKIYHFDTLKKYPFSTLYLLALDYAGKLPEIETTYLSMLGDIFFQGNYEGAGYLLAQDSRMITDLFYDIQ